MISVLRKDAEEFEKQVLTNSVAMNPKEILVKIKSGNEGAADKVYYSDIASTSLQKETFKYDEKIKIDDKDVEIGIELNVFSKKELNYLIPDKIEYSADKRDALVEGNEVKDGYEIRIDFKFLEYDKVSKEKCEDDKSCVNKNVALSLYIKDKDLDAVFKYLGLNQEILLKNVPWYSQFDEQINSAKGTGNVKKCDWCSDPKGKCNNCCKSTCAYILQQAGVTYTDVNRLNAAELIDKTNINSGFTAPNYQTCIERIYNNLKNKKPVIIGVNRSLKTSTTNNFNPASHHYVVIIGSGYDKIEKKYCFYFHEVGTTRSAVGDGTSKLNVLFLDESTHLITGICPYNNNDTYTITEVIDNL
jgi:hypothetical protein